MSDRCTVNNFHPQDTSQASRPLAAEVGSAVARALMPGASDADLRALVVAYTRALRDEGLPPEQALVCVKGLIVGATTRSLNEAFRLVRGEVDAFKLMRADAISSVLGSWFVAAYFRAD